MSVNKVNKSGVLQVQGLDKDGLPVMVDLEAAVVAILDEREKDKKAKDDKPKETPKPSWKDAAVKKGEGDE